MRATLFPAALAALLLLAPVPGPAVPGSAVPGSALAQQAAAPAPRAVIYPGDVIRDDMLTDLPRDGARDGAGRSSRTGRRSWARSRG